MVVASNGSIYVAGQTGFSNSGYKYMLSKWIEKTVYVPVPSDGFSSSGGYITNNKQLRNGNGTGNQDVVFYNQSGRVATYLDNSKISYQLVEARDSSDQDTTFRVDMAFTKGVTGAKIYPFNERPEYINFYLGHMPKASERTAISNTVIKSGAYTNTDIIYTQSKSGFRHWIIARTGAPVADFEMTFTGQSSLSVNGSGQLVVATTIGNITFSKAKAYSMNNSTGALTLLSWQPSFAVSGSAVGLTSFGTWSGTLVLEFGQPISGAALTDNDWYTYWGGPAKDEAMDIIVDDIGSVYITGLTESALFPNVVGGFITDFEALSDVFISKFDDTGALLVGTFFGGDGYDVPFALTQNSANDVYIVGQTQSDNLIIESTEGTELQGIRDGFIIRLNSTLDDLLFSRYIGAEQDNSIDVTTDVSVDLDNEVFVVGTTGGGNGSGFPIKSMSGAYNQTTSSISSVNNPDGYVLKFNELNEQLWGTYFGGGELEHISSIEVKPSMSGEFMILGSTFSNIPASSDNSNTPCGVPNSPSFFPDCESFGMFEPFTSSGADHEMFIAEFSNAGQLIWSSYFGGQDNETSTFQLLFKMSDIIYDKNDNAVKFIVGTTSGTDFISSGISAGYVQTQDFNGANGRAFLMRLDGHTPYWSTVFGCNSSTWGISASSDDDSNVYLVGITKFSEYGALSCQPQMDQITEFPKCQAPEVYFQEQYNGGQAGDVFVAGFDALDQLKWSTFFGGDNGDEVRASAFDDINDRLYIVGRTNSTSTFPLSDPFGENFQQNENSGGLDAFIARFDINGNLTGTNEIDATELMPDVKVYPNPSSGDVSLSFDARTFGIATVELIDYTGRILRKENISVSSGFNSYLIQMLDLSAGIYVVRLTGESFSVSTSFVHLEK